MDKKHKFYNTLCLLVMILISLPAIQQLTHVFNLKGLNGFTDPVEAPELTFDNYSSNKLQTQVNDYLRQNFGFREWLIPLYNQYAWNFYGKTENNGVFFGKDNWLYFYEMLQDQYESLTYKYCQSGEEMAQKFERDAIMVNHLQEILKEYGTTLFVCIAPSKNELFPEYLPENDRFYKKGGVHADEFYTKRFAELGVNCLDLNTLYKSQKGHVDYPLFYKAGSHYSHIAATYSADTLIKYMESVSGLKIQDFEFGEPFIDSPKNIDRDMENLYNLIFPIESVDYEYVHIKPVQDSTSVKMRWFTIGDSFYWNISEEIREAELFASTPFWYYGKEVYYDFTKTLSDNADLVDELTTSDIVMILWCPINLYDLDHKFVKNSVIAFCYDDDYYDKTKNKVIEKIKNNQEWYEAVVKQAEEKKESIDEALDAHAKYVLEKHPDEYYQEINGLETPTLRNSRLDKYKKLFENRSKEELVTIKKMIRNMRDNQEFAKQIQEKATNNNITFDEQIILDVIWLLDNR